MPVIKSGKGPVRDALSTALGNILFEELKGIPDKVRSRFDKSFRSKVLISEEAMAYRWVRDWLCDHIIPSNLTSWELSNLEEDEEDGEAESFLLLPNDEEYRFLFEGSSFRICKTEDDVRRESFSVEGGEKRKRNRISEFEIRIWGKDVSIVERFVERCRQHSMDKAGTTIPVMQGRWGSWYESTSCPPREIGSVILDEGVAEALLEDIDHFMSDKAFYQRTCIPYRRGYLLYGPPGNGKSSLVHAIASHLKRSIHVLSLSSDISDESLGWLMRSVRKQGILLLEDVDCAFAKRKKKDSSDRVSFSGLLNAIDGVGAGEGRLLFMTTNHLDQLDPALIRAGRVDMTLELTGATADKARRMFLQFFPKEDLLARRFGEKIQKGRPMCELQNWLLVHRDDAERAVGELKAPGRRKS